MTRAYVDACELVRLSDPTIVPCSSRQSEYQRKSHDIGIDTENILILRQTKIISFFECSFLFASAENNQNIHAVERAKDHNQSPMRISLNTPVRARNRIDQDASHVTHIGTRMKCVEMGEIRCPRT